SKMGDDPGRKSIMLVALISRRNVAAIVRGPPGGAIIPLIGPRSGYGIVYGGGQKLSVGDRWNECADQDKATDQNADWQGRSNRKYQSSETHKTFLPLR